MTATFKPAGHWQVMGQFDLKREPSVAIRPFGSSRSSQAPSTIQQPPAQSAAQGSIERTIITELNASKMPTGFQGIPRKCDNHQGARKRALSITAMNHSAPGTIDQLVFLAAFTILGLHFGPNRAPFPRPNRRSLIGPK